MTSQVRGHRQGGAPARSAVRIAVPADAVAEVCRRHRIRRLAIFGSVLRDDFGAESDVDVLVEFEAGQTPGFGFVDVEDELSRLLGRRVDLHTAGSLSRYFRERVLAEAQPVYVA